MIEALNTDWLKRANVLMTELARANRQNVPTELA